MPLRLPLRTTSLVLALVSSACTYISPEELEEKRATIDQDLDGSPFSEDCDDLDADRAPGAPEIPYDGKDNDCGLDGDVVDADGDGFPGIDQATYEAQDPQEPYPELLVGKDLDCLDDPAVDARAADVFPETATKKNPNELPYDGLDANCDGSNDFDNDGDGFMPDTAEVDGAQVDVAAAFADYVATWGYEDLVAGWAPEGFSEPQLGDCRDTDPLISPMPTDEYGQPVEDTPYDGVDNDCDGSNDFDVDGDGYMPAELPDGSPTEPAYEIFVNAYYDGSPPWTLAPEGGDTYGDCLDEDDPALLAPDGVPVAAADVHPGATDDWYDGIDSDCGGENDFDQDQDAFMPATAVSPYGQVPNVAVAYETYKTAWGYEDLVDDWVAVNPDANLSEPTASPADCDDVASDTYPQALEVVGDGYDQDCDGSADSSAFAFDDMLWENPSRPRVGRANDHFYLLTASEVTVEKSGTRHEDGGAIFIFPLDDARSSAVPQLLSHWKPANPDNPIYPVLDMDVGPNGTLWAMTAYANDTGSFTHVYGRELDVLTDGSVQTVTTFYSVVSHPLLATGVDIVVDSANEPLMIACGPENGQDSLVVSSGSQPLQPWTLEPAVGDLCFLDGALYNGGSSADVAMCDSVDCVDWTVDRGASPPLLTEGAAQGVVWTDGDLREDRLVLVDPVAGVDVVNTTSGTVSTYLPSSQVIAADAWFDAAAGRLYVAAIVDDGVSRSIELVYGNPGAATVIPLPFVPPAGYDVELEGISVYGDSDRVMVAVSALGTDLAAPEDDLVGWLFLGAPP